jgi:hypothetical protein
MTSSSLEIVTAWRLLKGGVLAQGILMNGPAGGRLVIVEDRQVVEWTRSDAIGELQQRALAALESRRRAGWLPEPNRPRGRPRARAGGETGLYVAFGPAS